MNNKTIVWVVVAVVVVAGLAWWLVGRSPTVTAPGVAQTGSGSPTSMASLLAAGTSQKCTFANTVEGGAQTNGTVFTASGHMRGDYTVQTSAGQTITSHMITDGTTSYVWTDQTTQGMKMSFSGMTAMSSTQAGPGAQSVNPNQQMNYNCSGWSADQSEFTLPTNITFNDMNAMMQAAGGLNAGAGAAAGAGASAGAGNSAMCSQCNQLTNATQKAQCLAAMGCN